MTVKPEKASALPEGKAVKDTQLGRQVLSITGWLVLLAAILLALRPTSFSAARNVKNVPSFSTPVPASRPNPHIGPLDAPVTLVEFGDFACPACGFWNDSGILQKLKDKYGDQVRFVWTDYPSISLASPKAAEAARCAYDQGKFWEYHDYLFAHMEALGTNDLKIYARLLRLDGVQFDQCLDGGVRKAEVMADYQDAVLRQVGVLPTFFIQAGSQEMRLAGPPSFETLVSALDPLLTPAP